jgi:hypothetical protein
MLRVEYKEAVHTFVRQTYKEDIFSNMNKWKNITELILKRYVVKLWSGFIWHVLGSRGDALWTGNKPRVS